MIRLPNQDDQSDKVDQVNQAQGVSQDDQYNRADQVDQEDHGGEDDVVKHDQIDHSDKINDQAQPPFEKELVSSPSSSQLVEELLVELLVALFAPH